MSSTQQYTGTGSKTDPIDFTAVGKKPFNPLRKMSKPSMPKKVPKLDRAKLEARIMEQDRLAKAGAKKEKRKRRATESGDDSDSESLGAVETVIVESPNTIHSTGDEASTEGYDGDLDPHVDGSSDDLCSRSTTPAGSEVFCTPPQSATQNSPAQSPVATHVEEEAGVGSAPRSSIFVDQPAQSEVSSTLLRSASNPGAEGGEVSSTPPVAPQITSTTSNRLPPRRWVSPDSDDILEGEVISTPPVPQIPATAPPRSRKAFDILPSPFPTSLQIDIANNGKPNRTRIQNRVDTLLANHGLAESTLARAPLKGNLLIPSPKELPDLPFWAYRASGLLPQRLMDGVITALAEAEEAGCRPNINPLKKAQAAARKREREGLPPLPGGGARSDYEVPFHIGVFKHPSQQFTTPWVTKDTLQGLKGEGPTRQRRIAKMMALCKAIDNMVNGRVQGLLRHHFPDLLKRCREFARKRASSQDIVKHDMPLVPLANSKANDWPILRFGNLGTTVAIGRGQSEKLHLDIHDSEQMPTILMVLGSEGQDWNHDNGEGDMTLPTLGLSIPLYPGDILIFYASLLPHQVKLLPEEERHKRTVATLFTCVRTQLDVEEEHDRKRRRDEGSDVDDGSGN